MGIATQVEASMDQLLNTFVTQKSAALCTMMTPVALTAATIYIITIGYAIMRGDAQDPLHTILWKMFRVALVGGIALSGGMYQSYILNFITGLQGALISAFGASTTIGGLVDNMAQPFNDLGTALYSKATTGAIPDIAILVAAALTSIAEALLFIVGLGMALLAKVGLALVTAVGPVFIACAMFPSTQKWTESWMGQAMNFAFLNVLVAASISMLTSFASQFAQHVYASQDTTNIIKATTALLLCCGSLAVVMKNLPALASAMTGGASMEGIGRAIGQYLMNKMNDKKDDDKNKGGGRIDNNGGRRGGGGAGSEPLYQRNVSENMRRAA